MAILAEASQVHAQANGQSNASHFQEKSSEGLSGSAMSALGYFCGIIAVVALCIEPYNKDAKVRFNAMQAILLQASFFVGFVALGITTSIVGALLTYLLSAMNLYGPLAFVMGIFPVLTMLLSLAMLGTHVYLIVSAAQGGTPRIPVISAYAQKFVSKMPA